MKKKLSFFIVCLGMFLLTVGCQPSKKDSSSKTKVVVSLPPYVSIVQEIGSDSVNVVSAVPPGFDPHTHEIAPGQVKALENANLWIGIGELFEKKLLTALQESNQKIQILQLNEKVSLLSTDDDTTYIDACGSSETHFHGGKDLHIWLSPDQLIAQARIIAHALSSINPKETTLYTKNLSSFVKKAHNIKEILTKQLSPFQGRSVIVSHPFLGYFCKAFLLRQIAVECEGKAPRPQMLDTVLEFAKNTHAICVFTSPYHHNKGALLIAKKMNFKTYEINPLGKDPLATIQQIAQNIANAN